VGERGNGSQEARVRASPRINFSDEEIPFLIFGA